ncbi:MAG TPA: SCO family protein [Sphingomicrobium sp.]|nr:SCO family protein [Sphingomicrobium sp.]
MLKRIRLLLWIVVGLAALGGIYLALRPPAPRLESRETPLATIGGPFTLTGADGRPFASGRLQGKPAAIFFGFTHCPDVCPTTLARLAKLRRELGKGDDAFHIVFISVDPERDKPADVGGYTGLFGTPVIGLTGSAAQIEKVKHQFGVYSAKAPQPGGGYSVDHTATVFLVDRDGKFVSTLAHEEGDAVAIDKLRRIIS